MKELQKRRTGQAKKVAGLAHSSSTESARVLSFRSRLYVARGTDAASSLDQKSSFAAKNSTHHEKIIAALAYNKNTAPTPMTFSLLSFDRCFEFPSPCHRSHAIAMEQDSACNNHKKWPLE